MTRIYWLVGVCVLLAGTAQAQTRILVGTEGGSSFGSLFAGITVSLEQPITRHFEFDARYSFDPAEQHIALGDGWANRASAGGIVWLTKSLGLDGRAEYSSYSVSIAKTNQYAFGGLVLRKSIDYMPMRFTFNYLREFDNGISANGTETDHVQGGEFNMDMRVACAWRACYRVAFDFEVGRVLTQSNPACDGTYAGPVTCPRGVASSGAFTASLAMEFPRRRATEDEAF